MHFRSILILADIQIWRSDLERCSGLSFWKTCFSVRVNQCDRILETMAYFFEHLVPRVCIHSTGGNRKGDSRTICDLLIVWMLTGFWHGAAWNFLAWGCIMESSCGSGKILWGQYVEKLPNAVKHIYPWCSFLIGWGVFSPSLGICTEIYWCDVWNWCQWADGQAGMVLFAVELADLSDGSDRLHICRISPDKEYPGAVRQSRKMYRDRDDLSGNVCTFTGISGDTVIQSVFIF